MSAPYVDTSALAKWYLNEPGSDAFEAFITRRAVAAISRLSVIEFRCLLARWRRAGDLSAGAEIGAYRLFDGDLRRGHLDLYSLDGFHAIAALGLLERLAATQSLADAGRAASGDRAGSRGARARDRRSGHGGGGHRSRL